jgi:hypothetical protein
MKQTVTMKLGELEIGHNIFRDGHIYTVTRVDFHEDDTTVTVKLGYPRKIDDGFERIDHITSHSARPITVYKN